MYSFFSVIHIFIAIIVIVLVLVQDSKGGGALGIGGGSNSVLGATGAQTLAAKLTRFAAILFAVSCILLTVMTAKQNRSVIEEAAAPAEVSAPIETQAPAAPAGDQTKPEEAKK